MRTIFLIGIPNQVSNQVFKMNWYDSSESIRSVPFNAFSKLIQSVLRRFGRPKESVEVFYFDTDKYVHLDYVEEDDIITAVPNKIIYVKIEVEDGATGKIKFLISDKIWGSSDEVNFLSRLINIVNGIEEQMTDLKLLLNEVNSILVRMNEKTAQKSETDKDEELQVSDAAAENIPEIRKNLEGKLARFLKKN